MHRKKRPRLHRAAGLLAIAILCSCMTAAPVRCAPSGTCDPDRLQRVHAYSFLPVSSSLSSPPQQPVQSAALLQEEMSRNDAQAIVTQLVCRDYVQSLQARLFPPLPPEEKEMETIVYGRSGAGRELLAYRFGTGENVMVIAFAIHGWEDNFERDGQVLVDTAEDLMDVLKSRYEELVVAGDWTVYVLPCLNPDGLYDGWTQNGPGRCTTHYLDSSGQNSDGEGTGIDLNRCFPYAFRSRYDARNYCGSQPLAAREAQALAQFTQSVMGAGYNVLIDTHGWYRQTIVSSGWNGSLFQTFRRYFPGNEYVSLWGVSGYYTSWAAYTLGYDACLFEFPHVSSSRDFQEKGYGQDYIDAVCTLLETYE